MLCDYTILDSKWGESAVSLAFHIYWWNICLMRFLFNFNPPLRLFYEGVSAFSLQLLRYDCTTDTHAYILTAWITLNYTLWSLRRKCKCFFQADKTSYAIHIKTCLFHLPIEIWRLYYYQHHHAKNYTTHTSVYSSILNK